MINVAFVRGAYLNNFEGQNYIFGSDISLHAFASGFSIHNRFPFVVTRLPSLTDLPFQRAVKVLANRTLGDTHILFGLEKYTRGFDIFHTADPHYYYSYQLAKLRKSGKIRKLLVTSWETIPHNNETVRAKKRIKREVLSVADGFLCYTEKAKRALVEEGVDGKKIEIIPLGVDLTKFTAKPKRSGNVTYLFIGRLVPEKGVTDVYQAYKRIMSDYTRLRMIGEGPLEGLLREQIRKDGLESQVTLENKSYEEIPQAYRESDVFVLASRHTHTWEEQYGMVLVEAMASGLPVVAYASGAIPEVLGKAGVLVREGDVDALSQQLKSLTDKHRRDEIGTMGKERAEKRYDARLTASLIACLYKKLVR